MKENKRGKEGYEESRAGIGAEFLNRVIIYSPTSSKKKVYTILFS